MPDPINPHPSTPTVRTAIVTSSRVKNSRPSVERFNDHGNALPAADACGRQAAPPAAPAQLEQHGQHQARPAHAERMAERDRAAIDVHLVAIEAELFFDGEILPGEGFVDFDEVDVLE